MGLILFIFENNFYYIFIKIEKYSYYYILRKTLSSKISGTVNFSEIFVFLVLFTILFIILRPILIDIQQILKVLIILKY